MLLFRALPLTGYTPRRLIACSGNHEGEVGYSSITPNDK